MKEAAGEANMTVITIVLIGIVAAAGAILIPNLITNISMRKACTQAGGDTLNGTKCMNKTSGQKVCTVYEVTSGSNAGDWQCK